MVTLGFVELLEHTLNAEELDRLLFEDNHRGGPRTLRRCWGGSSKVRRGWFYSLRSWRERWEVRHMFGKSV
jgi:hypothetical protein